MQRYLSKTKCSAVKLVSASINNNRNHVEQCGMIADALPNTGGGKGGGGGVWALLSKWPRVNLEEFYFNSAIRTWQPKNKILKHGGRERELKAQPGDAGNCVAVEPSHMLVGLRRRSQAREADMEVVSPRLAADEPLACSSHGGKTRPQTAFKPHGDTWCGKLPRRTVVTFCVAWNQWTLSQQHLVKEIVRAPRHRQREFWRGSFPFQTPFRYSCNVNMKRAQMWQRTYGKGRKPTIFVAMSRQTGSGGMSVRGGLMWGGGRGWKKSPRKRGRC